MKSKQVIIVALIIGVIAGFVSGVIIRDNFPPQPSLSTFSEYKYDAIKLGDQVFIAAPLWDKEQDINDLSNMSVPRNNWQFFQLKGWGYKK